MMMKSRGLVQYISSVELGITAIVPVTHASSAVRTTAAECLPCWQKSACICPANPAKQTTITTIPSHTYIHIRGVPKKGENQKLVRFRFLRATAVPAGTAEACISYGNSVCLSVCLSRPGGIPSPGEIETPGLHHMIA